MKNKRQIEAHEKRCADWNMAFPIGSEVVVTRDSGEAQRTKTRSTAYVCDSGYPVIFLDGITGYYLLDRVRPVTETGKQK